MEKKLPITQNTKKIKECILSNLNWLYHQNSRKLIQQFFLYKYPDDHKSVYKKFLIYFNKINTDILNTLKSDLNVSYKILKKLYDIIVEFSLEPIYYYNIKLHFLKTEGEIYGNILRDSFWFYERPYRSNNPSFGFAFNDYRFYNKNDKIVFKGRIGHHFKPYNADCLVLIKFVENDLEFIKHNNIYVSILSFDNFAIRDEGGSEFYKKENDFTLDNLKVDWDNISSNSMDFIESIINSLQLIKDSYFEFSYDVNIVIANLIEKLNKNNLSIDNLLNKSRILKIIHFDDEYFNFELKEINIFVGKNNTGKTFALNRIHLNPENYQLNSEFIKELRINSNFIPKLRYLSNSLGTFNNLVDMIKKFLISIFFVQNQKYLLYNLTFNNSRFKIDFPDFDFDVEEIKNMEIWNIPFFPEILEFFSTDFRNLDYFDELIKEDRLFISISFPLLALYKQVYENWKKAINNFFPDIEILDPQRIGKGARFKVKLADKYVEMDEEIEDWKELGSGIQELLSIVFYIEYIKISPVFDLKVFFNLLKTNKLTYIELLERLNYGDIILENRLNNQDKRVLRSFINRLRSNET